MSHFLYLRQFFQRQIVSEWMPLYLVFEHSLRCFHGKFVLPDVLFLLRDVMLESLHKLFDGLVYCLFGFIEVDRLRIVSSPNHLIGMAINHV